ncbi:MAG: hypothetical protein LBG58_12105 [Planctomycetaceae bacterium]|jgi:hypothetical protein|nr:hypothetical protein [Planctomycetaceae bacterium]
MVTNFTEGWLGADQEREDFEHFISDSEVCGQQWYVPFDDIKYRIYSEADLYNKWIPDWFTDYNYMQDASNGCAMINGVARTIWYSLQLMKRKGKEVIPFRVMEAWAYMLYHAYIAKDYGYGGCTMSGAMNAINKYGVLPYDVYGNVITDKQMVQLGWNRKQKSAEIMDKYGSIAENFQVKVTIPKTFNDIQACLKAGYAIGYGTTIGLKKGNDNIYRISGRCSHSMTYGFYKEGYFGHANSYGDNFGWLAENDAKRQIETRGFSCFCVIDIERGRKAAPNW